MYFENKLEEEIFAKALSLLNQLYGGAFAQEEHFQNKRKNIYILKTSDTKTKNNLGGENERGN